MKLWEDQTILGGGGDITNIGIITGNKVVDLDATSKDVLYGTLMENSVITFSNPDQITNLNLELTIGTLITSLSVGGETINLTGYGVGDKIYIEAKTTDTGNIWIVKKR